jgi:hypothetical protein
MSDRGARREAFVPLEMDPALSESYLIFEDLMLPKFSQE